MPNSLTATGITISTQQEDIDFLTGWYEQIFGQNIDLSSATQDGQMLNIYVQILQDVKTQLVGIYDSRDINQAVGVQLDQLIFWTTRLGGTFTQQPVSITVNGACTFYGQDQSVQPVYTVQDAQGNQYQLLTTQAIVGAGTASYSFEAANPGDITSPVNTITVPVTVVPQVTAINNPSLYTAAGVNEETDMAFRIRALASLAAPSQGFFNGLFANLGEVPQAGKIFLYENKTDAIDANGVPAHCIWAIVQGAASPQAIAMAIYNQKSLGCNMKGAQSYTITQDDDSTFVVNWDNVIAEQFYIRFTATSIDGVHPPNIALILQNLPVQFVPAVGVEINIDQVISVVNSIDPNTLVSNCGLSTSSSGPFTNTLTPTALNYQFVPQTANIFITPIVLLPQTSRVAHGSPGGSVQFTAYGGTQTGYTYTFVTNNSGGTLNSSTGAYAAGNTGGITDTIQVQDSGGNITTATITVT